MKRIGIDVGGTNTDAVLIDGNHVVISVKTPTTDDVTGGITKALHELIDHDEVFTRDVELVVVGTTHFVNAVTERSRLRRVAVLRLCLPASASVGPFSDWPQDLRSKVQGSVDLLPGGYEVDGREIAPLDEERVRAAAVRIRDSGLAAVVISGVFSPLRSEQELRAAEIVRSVAPNADITLSHDLGRIGLLERENVSILNAALGDLARKTSAAFATAISSSGLAARLYFTQNDGTIVPSEIAERFPVLCFGSGPTNSMRGAAFLSGLQDAAVIDVGGTTSDIGMLQNGFPREANTVVTVGGVRTLFRMPDLISLPMGGGTRIHFDPLELGPDSLGFHMMRCARIFGGSELCVTDVAVAANLALIGDKGQVESLDQTLVASVIKAAHLRLEDGLDRIKTHAGDVPLVVVGGAAFLVPKALSGISEVVHVPHYEVANAIGAAIAQISGDVDQIYKDVSRHDALDQATALARSRAVKAGASEQSLKVVEVEELPLSYMPGNCRRVRVRVVGDIK